MEDYEHNLDIYPVSGSAIWIALPAALTVPSIVHVEP